jgi:hypothetical protein
MAIKPSILAFHGSGSTGTVHTVQLARLNRHLKFDFEFVSLEGVFFILPTLFFHLPSLPRQPIPISTISNPNQPVFPTKPQTHPPISALPRPPRPRHPPLLRRTRSLQALADPHRNTRNPNQHNCHEERHGLTQHGAGNRISDPHHGH